MISDSGFSNCLVVSKFLFLHQWDFLGEKLVLLAVGARLVSPKRDPAEPATGRGGEGSALSSAPPVRQALLNAGCSPMPASLL